MLRRYGYATEITITNPTSANGPVQTKGVKHYSMVRSGPLIDGAATVQRRQQFGLMSAASVLTRPCTLLQSIALRAAGSYQLGAPVRAAGPQDCVFG